MIFGSKDHQSFLDNLKVGDTVCYEIPSWSRSIYKVETIVRITPKRTFVLSNNQRFTPRGTSQVDKYHRYYLMPYTSDIIESMLQHKLAQKAKIAASRVDYDCMEIAQLKKIIPVLEEVRNVK